MSFLQKLLAAFAFLVVLAGGLGLRATQQLAAVATTAQAERHDAGTVDTANKVAAALAALQLDLRGYLLGADGRFLDRLKADEDGYRAAISALQDAVSDNSDQQARVGELRRLVEGWRTDVRERATALAAQQATGEEARQLEAGAGEEARAAIQRKLGEIDAVQRELHENRVFALARVMAAFESFLLFATGGFVAALLLMAIFLSVGIVRPVSRIARAMWQVARGEPDVALPDLGRSDEVGEIAQIVELFKRTGEENERLRTAQQFFEKRLRDEKRIAVQNVTKAFETKVGSLMKALESSATQMETTAQSMSATADIASQQASVAAQSAEETIAQVQAILARNAGLAGSIKGIGRQATEEIETHITQVKAATRDVVSAVEGIEAFMSQIGEYAETGGQPAPSRPIIPTGVHHAGGSPDLSVILTPSHSPGPSAVSPAPLSRVAASTGPASPISGGPGVAAAPENRAFAPPPPPGSAVRPDAFELAPPSGPGEASMPENASGAGASPGQQAPASGSAGDGD